MLRMLAALVSKMGAHGHTEHTTKTVFFHNLFVRFEERDGWAHVRTGWSPSPLVCSYACGAEMQHCRSIRPNDAFHEHTPPRMLVVCSVCLRMRRQASLVNAHTHARCPAAIYTPAQLCSPRAVRRRAHTQATVCGGPANPSHPSSTPTAHGQQAGAHAQSLGRMVRVS